MFVCSFENEREGPGACVLICACLFVRVRAIDKNVNNSVHDMSCVRVCVLCVRVDV
jgi:hypothetical protein